MLVNGVSKYFGPIAALDGVTFNVLPGEIHGLVGHNGSGKSTLMRILTGFYTPDEGEITFAADETSNVAAIHQDLCLLDDMTVVENFGISTGYDRRGMGAISWRTQRRLASENLRSLGVDSNPGELVGNLAPAEKAAVAIARAVSEIRRRGGNGVLIVDEATAYFSQREIDVVRGILRRLADEGHSVIFISHNLRETRETCDRITVLRNGRVIDTFVSKEVDEPTIVSAMLGRTLDSYYPPMSERPPADPSAPPRLSVSGISDEQIRDFSLDVAAGEVVGVTGILGTGFDRIPYLLAGSHRAHAGSISVDGTSVELDPRRTAASGISLVPANRAAHGLWMDETTVRNFTVPRLGTFWRKGRMDLRGERVATDRAIKQFGVLPGRFDLPMSAFSGGNQQKVLLASRLDPTKTKVLLLHEPTQGVDSGAKVDILRIVQDAAASGVAVVVFSSDHEELVNTCSRVLILSTDGRVVSELATESLDE
ncbi:MAG: sugar ABC transporter ATP-binding protein, partial [Actinomycetota bacterium]